MNANRVVQMFRSLRYQKHFEVDLCSLAQRGSICPHQNAILWEKKGTTPKRRRRRNRKCQSIGFLKVSEEEEDSARAIAVRRTGRGNSLHRSLPRDPEPSISVKSAIFHLANQG